MTVIELFLKELLVPIFWIFKSLVKKDHRLVFQFVLKQHGTSPDQVTYFSLVCSKSLHVLKQVRRHIDCRSGP